MVRDGIAFSQTIEAAWPQDRSLTLEVAGERYEAAADALSRVEGGVAFEADVGEIVVDTGGSFDMALVSGGQTVTEGPSNTLPGLLSILPAVPAIGIAPATRQAIPSLFLGVVPGAWFTYRISVPGIRVGLRDTTQIYALEALVPRAATRATCRSSTSHR